MFNMGKFVLYRPRERDETERVIRCTLKEIMMSVDLDEVTSKAIRGRLEDELDMDLAEYKSFIDQEMLTILGQMDAPTEIFEHVYLGSEWNASNLEELQRNGYATFFTAKSLRIKRIKRIGDVCEINITSTPRV